MKYATGKNVMKRFAAILSVIALVLTFTVSALANEASDESAAPAGSVTITNNTEHNYYAYQIFTGTQASGDPALGEIEWGNGVANGAKVITELQADSRFEKDGTNIFASCKTAADVAEALGQYVDNSDYAKAFANVLSFRNKDNPTLLNDDNRTLIEKGAVSADLDPGYYLLIDAGVTEGDQIIKPGTGDAYNSALLQVTSDITIAKKYSVPTVNKDIIENGEHVEATDVAIGDTVTFEIVGTLPSNYDDFEFYRYIFRDTMSHGLELMGDYEVGENGYDDRPVTSGITVEVQNGNEKIDITDKANQSNGMKIVIAYAIDTNAIPKGNITVQFDDLKEFAQKANVHIDKDSKIIITYSAYVTQYATTGNTNDKEQSNRVFLEYYRNPNDSSDENHVNRTPEDVVLIFTYELDGSKYDMDDPNKKLDGAEFYLYREGTDGKKEYVQLGIKNDTYKVVLKDTIADADIKLKGWTENPAEATVLKPTKDTPFRVIGLDAGTYYLEEIKAPAGYNKLDDPVEITISAKLDTDEDHPGPGTLTITVDNGEPVKKDSGLGIVDMEVGNARGSLLPSTGGMGTTLFYIGGTVLVIGAAVMLFKRRRSA